MAGSIQDVRDKAENNTDMFHDLIDFPICWEWQKKIIRTKYEDLIGEIHFSIRAYKR